MSTEIGPVGPRTGQITMALAKVIAQAEQTPKELRNRPQDVLLLLLSGRELGIGPMASLRMLYLIPSTTGEPPKVSLSASLQLALLRRAGHRVTVIEETDDRVAMEAVSAYNGDVVIVEYTLAEVQESGIAKTRSGDAKRNWRVAPKDMLWARCVTRLARRLDAMATGGMYAPEDFDQAMASSDPPVVTVEVDEVGTEALPFEPTEAGELPLKPEDLPIMVSCPQCDAKVATTALSAHLQEAHADD